MVVEHQILPYLTWLLQGGDGEIGALPRFVITLFAGGVLALVAGYLIALVRNGPLQAGDITYRVVSGGFRELLAVSPQRVSALAWLAVKESLRRSVLIAVIVFLLILLFASWFLRTDHQDPAKLFSSFVMNASSLLLMMIALLLGTFSLPTEFKTKTIYTIMTKPVRAGDVILGRILGFSLIGTALLLFMGICSYVFVTRSLDHVHQVEPGALENVTSPDGDLLLKRGLSSRDQYHRHVIEVDEEGYGRALSAHGHQHTVFPDQNNPGEIAMASPDDVMQARVPSYGRLGFRDRKGVEVARGISVGSEWTYRSYIEGGTSAAAVWTFEGISERSFKEDNQGAAYLPLELIVRVFRTYKGDIERGIQGSIQLRNPDPEKDVRSSIETFTAKDISIDNFNFPRKLVDSNQREIDLLEDLVSDGKIEVWVQCLERAQYYGFAQADCYVRLPDASPLWNFIKAHLSIWIQMLLVIAIGVTCSTLVNGPVAMLFTLAYILLGFFREFFVKVAIGEQVGGGPVESLVRMVTQKNLTTKLGDSIPVQIMYGVDGVMKLFMRSVSFLLPDFRSLSTVDYVAFGFNIPIAQVAQDISVGFAFLLGLFLTGYFFLRTREVAK